MNLTRRNFIKLGIFSVIGLTGCKSEDNPINEWVATGESKIFDEGTHVIMFEEECDDFTSNSQVEVPAGYSLISAQEVIKKYDKIGYDSKTVSFSYAFVNKEPVEALEYVFYDKNGYPVKREYPFAGSPIQKVLVREGR